MDVSRPQHDVALAAELLGDLQRIQQLAVDAIRANSVVAFEEALDEIADIACTDDHGDDDDG